MKVGSTVKVLARKALPPGVSVWVKGKVLGVRHIDPPVSTTVYKVGFGEYSSYQEREFERQEIKTYQEQSDEEFNANVDRDMPIGLALAQEALAELLPSETVMYKDADRTISGYHGTVTIDPVQYDAPRIGGEIEQTGYQVTVWKYIPATRHQPDEYVDSPVGTFPTIQRAVQEFVKTMFAVKSQDYWEHKEDEAKAAAWKAGEL
jgi:hypothetical protein